VFRESIDRIASLLHVLDTHISALKTNTRLRNSRL